MTCEFPRAYDIVRQGRPEPVRVRNLDELVVLRTELELIRRFGAGASTGLIEAIDRRTAEILNSRRGDGSHLEQIRELEDMRAILCDSLSPVNAQALVAIDRDCPEAIAGASMDSINKDTQAFREDLKGELAGSDNVDALLATFAQADQETASEQPAPTSTDTDLDEDLQALLAEAAGQREPADAALVELAATIPETNQPAVAESAPSSLTEASEIDAVLGATTAATPSPDSAASEDLAPGNIENVTEHVAQSLTTAEAQLDAIASAFEVAAAELGQMSTEVAEAVGPAAKPSEAEADDLAKLAAWDAGTASEAGGPLGIGPSENSQPVVDEGQVPDVSAQPIASSIDASTPVPAAASIRSAGQLRSQLKQARANILSELDDVLVMLERVDQMQAQADQAVRKAREFEQAATRAQAAGQTLAAAEAEAAKARAAFEQAQSRAVGARQAWQQAQQAASAAAETCQPNAS